MHHGLANDHTWVKRCKRGLFMYSLNDTFIGRSLHFYGEWCDTEIEFLRSLIHPGDVVLDVGANIGTHTVPFSQFVGPEGEVHAFEPLPELFHMLAGNAALNNCHNVVCRQAAVGKSLGVLPCPSIPAAHEIANRGAASFMREAADLWPHVKEYATKAKPVRLMTIDALDLDRCDLIKIDVEGMEEAVLAGAKDTVRRCRPLIYLEGREREESLADFLDASGYVAWWSFHNYFNPANAFGQTRDIWPEIGPSINLLCAPREMNLVMTDHESFLGKTDEANAAIRRGAEHNLWTVN